MSCQPIEAPWSLRACGPCQGLDSWMGRDVLVDTARLYASPGHLPSELLRFSHPCARHHSSNAEQRQNRMSLLALRLSGSAERILRRA
eukprot:764308-Hanusia_phi.AAC.4